MKFINIELIIGKIKDIITSPIFYQPVIYIAIGVILNFLLSKITSRITIKVSNSKDKRKSTIINLVKSIVKYLILIFVVLGIIDAFGVNTTSIIASLGVAAAIIGLAFQDILKDFLAGITIIFDNKYAVGDIVEINGFTGTVISLGLRTTKIKAFTGEVKCIGNSSFTEVTNYNLAVTDLFIKLNVAYNTNIDKLEKVLESLRKEILSIENVQDYKLLGVDALGDSSIVYLIDITCKATTGAGIKRKVLRLIKDTFDKEKINIPYTTVDVNIRK